MKIYILQSKLFKSEHFQFISAHQTFSGAQRKVRELVPATQEIDWKSIGFRWVAETKEYVGLLGDVKMWWQIFETELEGYIQPQVEPLDFSPVPEE